MEYLVVDTETGGLDSEVHSLLSLALIRCTANYQVLGEPLHLHVKQENFVVNTKAMEVNQLDIRESGSWLPRDAVITNVLDFLEYPSDYQDDAKYKDADALYKLCGSNIAFDIGFLRKFFGDKLYTRMFHYKAEEVTSAFSHLQRTGVIPPNHGLKLVEMAEALELKIDTAQFHDALYDAEITRAVARELYKRSKVLALAFDDMLCKYGNDPRAIIKCFNSNNPKKKLQKLKTKKVRK